MASTPRRNAARHRGSLCKATLSRPHSACAWHRQPSASASASASSRPSLTLTLKRRSSSDAVRAIVNAVASFGTTIWLASGFTPWRQCILAPLSRGDVDIVIGFVLAFSSPRLVRLDDMSDPDSPGPRSQSHQNTTASAVAEAFFLPPPPSAFGGNSGASNVSSNTVPSSGRFAKSTLYTAIGSVTDTT